MLHTAIDLCFAFLFRCPFDIGPGLPSNGIHFIEIASKNIRQTY